MKKSLVGAVALCSLALSPGRAHAAGEIPGIAAERDRLAVQLGGGRQHLIGAQTGLADEFTHPGNAVENLAGAHGRAIHAFRDPAGRLVLLMD